MQLNGTNKLWRYNSLRGGHLKGKGKGVLGARETRFPPAPNPLSIPFQTPATQASDINETRSGLTDQTQPPFQFDYPRDVDNNTPSHPGPGYEQKDHDQNPEKPASDITVRREKKHFTGCVIRRIKAFLLIPTPYSNKSPMGRLVRARNRVYLFVEVEGRGFHKFLARPSDRCS